MNTKLQLATLVSSFIILHSAFGQGALTPPGAPAPTMKSLDQIEPRTPISAVPFTITNSGSYYLTDNLSDSLVVSLAGTNAITIAASGVTLDLNGFTLACTLGTTGSGIQLSSGLSDITIANGHLRGGVTNNGSGVYSGNGFGSGIYYSGTAPVNVRVTGVSVSGCLYYGIYLNKGASTLVESCTVRTVGNYGVLASTIKQSTAIDCGGTAIYGDQVSDCRSQATGSGYGLSATIANNCYGTSSSGTGLYAATANNCYGVSSGSGTGLYAYEVATGCFGYSGSGTGLYAYIANSCNGNSENVTYKYNMP